MVCSSCLEHMQLFSENAHILREDQEAIDIITRAITKGDTQARLSKNSILDLLWPKVTLLFRPALLYAIIALLLIPTLKWMLQENSTLEARIQTIHLVGLRSQSNAAFSRALNLDGIIVLVCNETRPDSRYEITVSDNEGNLILWVPDFDRFDILGTGYLLFPKEKMLTGSYTLEVSQTLDTEHTTLKTFKFSIVQ